MMKLVLAAIIAVGFFELMEAQDHPLPESGSPAVDSSRNAWWSSSFEIQTLLADSEDERAFAFLALEDPDTWRMMISEFPEGSYSIYLAAITIIGGVESGKYEFHNRSREIESDLVKRISGAWYEFLRLTRWGDRSPVVDVLHAGEYHISIERDGRLISGWFDEPEARQPLLESALDLANELKRYVEGEGETKSSETAKIEKAIDRMEAQIEKGK